MRIRGISLLLVYLALTFLFNSEAAFCASRDGASTMKSKQTSFSFIVWGHPRGAGDGMAPLHFEEILERVEKLHADFLIVTGDVVVGGGQRQTLSPEKLNVIRGDWQRFDDGVKRLGIPVYLTPGNHDIHSVPTRDLYLEFYPKPPFAFTFQGSRFILLDTLGIDQQSARSDGNEPPWWDGGAQSFDKPQMDFIRSEIAGQNAYQHIFIFMHHVNLWRDSSGLWWRDVHPMLRGGRVRAVFSGTPTEQKYLHLEEDGIHYILSCTVGPNRVGFFRSLLSGRWEAARRRAGLETSSFAVLDSWALHHQLDNIQHVRVEGDEIEIETIVVGAWNSPASSPRFWDDVKKSKHETLEHRVLRWLGSSRRLLFVAGLFAGVCVLAGIIVATLWRRFRHQA